MPATAVGACSKKKERNGRRFFGQQLPLLPRLDKPVLRLGLRAITRLPLTSVEPEGALMGALLKAHHVRLGTRERSHCPPIWTYEAAVSGRHAASSFRTRVSDLNLTSVLGSKQLTINPTQMIFFLLHHPKPSTDSMQPLSKFQWCFSQSQNE